MPGDPPQLLRGFTRRPVVPVALLLCIGILLHRAVPLEPFPLLIAISTTAILAAAFIRAKILSTAAISLCILLLGISIARREHFQFSADDIGQFATDEPHLTELQVRLLDDPRIVIGSDTQRMLPPKQIVTADVLRVKTQTGWQNGTGRLPIQIDQPHPALAANQTIDILGMLQRPRAAMNPGEFDWAAYYRQQRILANFAVTRAGNIHIISDPGPTVLNWLRAKARHLLASGFMSDHAAEQALMEAMLLGERDPPLRDIQAEFQNTGMGYQLSVSGLHIGLFAAILFWICRRFRLRPRLTLFIVTAFVTLFAAVALPSHSGIRAAILSIVVAAAVSTGRSVDRLQVLCLAVIAMLLWHPLDLYSAGFHLSFAVVFAFAFLLDSVRKWLQSQRDPDAVVRDLLVEKSPWQKLIASILGWISQSAQFAVIAWLATLPLVVYHFGQASGWSILGSLLLLPLVLLSLLAASAKILLTLLWPIAAGRFAVLTGWPAHLLIGGVHLLSKLPGSSIPLPAPPVWLIVVYYLLLFSPLLPHRWWLVGRKRWVLRLAPLLGVAGIFFIHASPPPAIDGLRVTLLSLGAGQCAVVELPGGHVVLIDAGSTTVSDVARKIVEPYLHAQGEQQVDDIFLSHGDFDHISAAGEITAANGVGQVLVSYHFRKNAVGNVPDQMLLEELEKLDRSPKEIAIGDHFDLGSGAVVQVLWPPKTGELNSNNAGLVLRLTYAGRSILFPADIQDPGFTGVLQNSAALKSDILIAAHHGSSEDLTPAFLAAVKPQIILSSNFWRLTSKQRTFEKMIGRTPLYRTPECGAITVTIHPDGTFAVTTFVKGAKPK